ncbi:MAG TPA: substrate-binding domain-containing protein [Polyangiaceae bacterium]|nr:substrate-binding domain-containing protein [Polyangiaceae bacterium]
MTTAGARDVALLLDRIDEPYQSELFEALRSSAGERGLSLICFLGGPPRSSDESGDPRSRIFELARRADLAGAVIAAKNLSSRAARTALASMAALLTPAPAVSLGAMLEGVPAVLLDNHDAMRQLVEHLIVSHGKSRIAFVRGPQRNEEAEDRYRGYLRALFDHELTPDDALVVPGDLDRASGVVAAQVLLERGVEFDAVVATSDRTASGVLDELRARGRQVAVAGCDDSQEARFDLVPLTSMRQPIGELASCALDVLLEPSARATRVLPAELVVRRSCGCEGELRVRASMPPSRGEQELPLLRRRSELVAAMRQAAPFADDARWADAMFSSFVSDVRGKTHAAFAAQTEQLLELGAREGGDATHVQRVVDVLRSGALPSLTELPGMMLRAEAALYSAGVAIAGALHAGGQRHGLSVQDAAQVLSNMAHELTLRVGVDQIGSSLERYLPRLGIERGGLATLPRGAPLSELHWVWCWGGDDVHWWNSARRSPQRPSPTASVVMPLAFEDELLGVASFEVGPLHGVVLETLRALLSSALAHSVLRTAAASR